MTTKPPYRVQFSHDRNRWYDLSGRGDDPSFPTIGEADAWYNKLLGYVGLLSFVRMIDGAGLVVKGARVQP